MNYIRVGVLGSVDTGKSSLIGVLKSNKLDKRRLKPDSQHLARPLPYLF